MRRCPPTILWAACLLAAWLAAGQTALGLSKPAEKGGCCPSRDALRTLLEETATGSLRKPGGTLLPSPFGKGVGGEGTDREESVLSRPRPPDHNPLPEGEGTFRSFLTFQGKLNSLEERLLADAADGYLDEHPLLDAALIASGVENFETLRHYRQQWAALVGQLRRSGTLSGSPRQRAAAVLDFMHRRILGAGYRIECTDLRLALDHGWFNCVSATVLFNCLAGELGLSVCGLETPGHAKSRLFLPNGSLDVETTCPRWFRLIGDPLGQAEDVRQTLGEAPAKDHDRVREVSALEMAAMIYYNRGVDLLAEKQFAAAAAANAKALRLDPSSAAARGNLLATINNWAIALGTRQRYVEAANLLKQGMGLDPSFQTFLLNYVHVYHQWTQHLCADGRFAEALDLLSGAAAEHPEQPYFRRAPAEIYRRWARSLFEVGKTGQTNQPVFADLLPHTTGKPLASDIDR